MQINNCRKSDKQYQKRRLRIEKQKWKKKTHSKHRGRRELSPSCLFYFPEYLIRYRVLFKDRLFKIGKKFWKMLSEVYCFWLNSYPWTIVLFTIFAPHWSFSFNDPLYFPVKSAHFCTEKCFSWQEINKTTQRRNGCGKRIKSLFAFSLVNNWGLYNNVI